MATAITLTLKVQSSSTMDEMCQVFFDDLHQLSQRQKRRVVTLLHQAFDLVDSAIASERKAYDDDLCFDFGNMPPAWQQRRQRKTRHGGFLRRVAALFL